MDETTIIYPGVAMGDDATVGRMVEIGVPPGVDWGEDTTTVIGAGATIRSHTVIYAGNRIGDGFQTGHHALVREHNTIGDKVSVGSGCVIEHHVTIGHGVRIHSQAFVPEYSVLEDGCWLGPNVVFINDRYPNSRRSKAQLQGPHVGKRARIGANSTVLPGVRIGVNALVGAGSVVTKDVPPGKVVAGNPAREIGEVADLRRSEYPDEPVYD